MIEADPDDQRRIPQPGELRRLHLECMRVLLGNGQTLHLQPVAADGKKGDLTYHFKADGFGPNCDPNRKPNFDIRHPRSGKGTTTKSE